MKQLLSMKSKDGLSADYLACSASGSRDASRRLETLRTLHRFGAELSPLQRDSRGWTAAHWVCQHGDLSSLTFLEDHSGELFVPDYRGTYPVDVAAAKGSPELVGYLRSVFVRNRDNKLNRLKFMKPEERLKWEASLSAEDAAFYFYSSRHLNHVMVYWSLFFGLGTADLDMQDSCLLFGLDTQAGRTLYHAVVLGRHPQVKTLDSLFAALGQAKIAEGDDCRLLAAPAHWSAEFRLGWAVPMSKRFAGRLKGVVGKKRVHLCEWDVQDCLGDSSLHSCTKLSRDDCIGWFLTKGSDFQLENRAGFTPCHLAQTEQTVEVYRRFFRELREASTSNKDFYPCTRWMKEGGVQGGRCCRKKVYVEVDKEKLGREKEALSRDLVYHAETAAFFNLALKVKIRGDSKLSRIESMERCDYLIDVLINRGYEVSIVTCQDSLLVCIRACFDKIAQVAPGHAAAGEVRSRARLRADARRSPAAGQLRHADFHEPRGDEGSGLHRRLRLARQLHADIEEVHAQQRRPVRAALQELLGADGALSGVCRPHHARVLRVHPHIRRQLRGLRRPLCRAAGEHLAVRREEVRPMPQGPTERSRAD
jgi:hypothetical protein